MIIFQTQNSVKFFISIEEFILEETDLLKTFQIKFTPFFCNSFLSQNHSKHFHVNHFCKSFHFSPFLTPALAWSKIPKTMCPSKNTPSKRSELSKRSNFRENGQKKSNHFTPFTQIVQPSDDNSEHFYSRLICRGDQVIPGNH